MKRETETETETNDDKQEPKRRQWMTKTGNMVRGCSHGFIVFHGKIKNGQSFTV